MDIRQVTLPDVLRARDARADRQQHLLQKYRLPLISFTMNIAGSIKCNPGIEAAFREGKRRIERSLAQMQLEAVDADEIVAFTGCEALWAVNADPEALKTAMCAIEEQDALGRLFDIDVIDGDGRHLSRANERSCLICGGPVRACARSRSHSADELFACTMQIISDHFRDAAARRLGEIAQRALLCEALTTPKPGLVDCEDSGAHRDMDLFSFADSACALRGYFEACARVGLEEANAQRRFARLRCLGLEAEADMLAAAGANTHKGAIFSLGILCCSAADCADTADTDAVLRAAAELGRCSLRALTELGPENARTGGERQYLQLGLTGARGEAASGFQTVREIALPALEAALDRGLKLNDAGLRALIALMAAVPDSNILRRAGEEALRWVQDSARTLIQNGFSAEDLRSMNREFIYRNISPGGSADLLAVTYFLYFLQKDQK